MLCDSITKSMNFSLDQNVSFWDLGSMNGRLYTRELGILVTDNTYVARLAKTRDVVIIGKDAYSLIEKIPSHLESYPTVQKGVVADEQLLSHLISSWKSRIAEDTLSSFFFRPTAIVTVPYFIDSTHIRATMRSFVRAGFGDVVLVPTPLALVAFHDIAILQKSCVVIDCGAGKTEITCVCRSGIVVSQMIPEAGNALHECVRNFIETTYDMESGAEEDRKS